MAKEIIWCETAQKDRKEILLYWKNRNKSPTYSNKLNVLFDDAAKINASFPKTGKPFFILFFFGGNHLTI